jgi:hypothetical protein
LHEKGVIRAPSQKQGSVVEYNASKQKKTLFLIQNKPEIRKLNQ